MLFTLQNALQTGQTVPYLLEMDISGAECFDPFAYTDTLLNYVETSGTPLLHYWTMKRTLILGMKDTQLDRLDEALNLVRAAGYEVVVRNAGGLAVVSDEGVLNASFMLKSPSNHKVSIDEAYLLMMEWIELTFGHSGGKIKAFEVTRSYCPGAFDLSIGGKKFAGIAQRRIKNSISVMIYLSLYGDQMARGSLVRDFYQTGLSKPLAGYPLVDPHSMMNLSDLLDKEVTTELAISALNQTLIQHFHVSLKEDTLPSLLRRELLTTSFQQQLQKMKKRNERFLTKII